MRTITRKMIAILRRVGTGGLVAIFVGVMICAALELAGVGLVYWIGRALVGSRTGGAAAARGAISNTQILTAAATVAGLYLFKNICVVALNIYVQKRAWVWFQRMADALFARYLLANYANVVSMGSADIRRSIFAAEQVVLQISMTARAAADVATAVALGSLLIAFDPILGPVLLLIGVGGLVGIIAPLRRRLGGLGESCMQSEHRITSSCIEAFGSLQDVRIYGRFNFLLQRMHRATSDYSHTYASREGLADIPRAATETIMMILVAVGAALIAFTGRTLAELIPFGFALLAAAMRLLPSLNRIAQCYSMWSHAEVFVNIVYDELFGARLDPEVGVAQQIPFPFATAIDVRGLSFAYPGRDRYSVADVNLRIRRGDCIGLAGTSGSGKSTLAHLLLGLLVPTEGEIAIDGVPIREDIGRWRANTGAVGQVPFLLDASIRDNIAFGVPAAEIDNAHLAQVVSLSRLDSFIAEIPEGLESRVGERGVLLSGGQRQRIAVARALYFNRSFLILDEATSALDSSTEKEIMECVAALRGRITIVIIAHRLTTLRNCDRILVMDDGHIVQDGTMQDLTAERGRFKEMLADLMSS
jgi:ATP-binding cassette, subfamily B, bacterial PglK